MSSRMTAENDQAQHDHAERPDLREQQHREGRPDFLAREAGDDEEDRGGLTPAGGPAVVTEWGRSPRP